MIPETVNIIRSQTFLIRQALDPDRVCPCRSDTQKTNG